MFLIHLHVDILLIPSLLLRTNLSCFVAIDLRRINGFERQVVANPDSNKACQWINSLGWSESNCFNKSHWQRRGSGFPWIFHIDLIYWLKRNWSEEECEQYIPEILKCAYSYCGVYRMKNLFSITMFKYPLSVSLRVVFGTLQGSPPCYLLPDQDTIWLSIYPLCFHVPIKQGSRSQLHSFELTSKHTELLKSNL